MKKIIKKIIEQITIQLTVDADSTFNKRKIQYKLHTETEWIIYGTVTVQTNFCKMLLSKAVVPNVFDALHIFWQYNLDISLQWIHEWTSD